VVADRRGARRIVYNLVENVADHTPEGTPFQVTALVNAGRGVLVVSDEGPGMDADEADGLWERRPGGNPAVGLPLVRELAEAMGAHVRYERARDGGARFMVAFRLAPPSASED
jgi:two-component system OmpR family sensor kinase